MWIEKLPYFIEITDAESFSEKQWTGTTNRNQIVFPVLAGKSNARCFHGPALSPSFLLFQVAVRCVLVGIQYYFGDM